MTEAHEGHRKRMRERFEKQGLDGFAPHEVLELILFYAMPRRNVNPIAHALMERFGSLHAVLEADAEALTQVEGVGESSAALLRLFAQVAVQIEKSRAGGRVTLSNRLDAERYCTRLLNGLKQEHFYAICLDGQMRVLHDELIARGSLSEVTAYPRLVVDAALRHNAHSLVLCHNHPGGSPTPSQSDIDTTGQLAILLSSLDVKLADHIIVADGRALSMAGSGAMAQAQEDDGFLARIASSAGETRIGRQMDKQNKRERHVPPKKGNML